MDVDKLKVLVEKHGAEKIAFVRLEAGTNLIGGQPFSLENMKEIHRVCKDFGIILI